MKTVLVFALALLIGVVRAEFSAPCEVGSTFHHEGSCSVFYHCYREDRPTLIYCPGIEEYNHQERRCSPPEEAKCILPDKSAWTREEKIESREGSEEDDVKSGEKIEWSREEDKEESKSGEDSGEDHGWFSFFHVTAKEAMREDEAEENSNASDEGKEETSAVASEESPEEHSFWKRQVPKRFRRSDDESIHEQPPLVIPSGSVVELDLIPIMPQGDSVNESDENARKRRDTKKDESVEKEEEEKEKDEESKPEDKLNDEVDETVVESKEAEENQASKEKDDVNEDSVETEDYPTKSGEEIEETSGGCGATVVSDPLEFHLLNLKNIEDTYYNKYKHLEEQFPFVLDTLVSAASAVKAQKERDEQVELSEEKGEEKVDEGVVEEEVKESPQQSVEEEQVEKKEEEQVEKKEEEQVEQKEEEQVEKKEEEEKDQEKTNEETDNNSGEEVSNNKEEN